MAVLHIWPTPDDTASSEMVEAITVREGTVDLTRAAFEAIHGAIPRYPRDGIFSVINHPSFRDKVEDIIVHLDPY